MARTTERPFTKTTGIPAMAARPVDSPAAFGEEPPPLVSKDGGGLLMKLVELEEVRVEKSKIMLPKKLDGTESDQQRAVVFYATAGKLINAKKEITAQGRVKAVASICNMSHIGDLNIKVIEDSAYEEIWTPSNWTIMSFHSSSGARLHTCTAEDPQVLLPIGDTVTNWGGNIRRSADITFVKVSVKVSLDGITKTTEPPLHQETFIELPKEVHSVKNGAGTVIEYTTCVLPADLRTWTPEFLKTEVLEKTYQTKVAGIEPATFGSTSATLDSDKHHTGFMEKVLEKHVPWLEGEIFKTVCPGVVFRPSSALNGVRQVLTDANGNTVIVPVHLYLTNVFLGMSCMGDKDYEMDVVRFAVDNMDVDIRNEMETVYTGHLQARTRDPLTQTRAIQELLVHATNAEKKVLNTRAIVHRQATALMVATVPGYVASPVLSSTPVHASVAERTLQDNSPIPPFEWTKGKCVCCGSADHKYTALRTGKVICPHAHRPGAKENCEKNYALLRGGAGRSGPAPYKKPKWESMSNKAKRSFANAMVASSDDMGDFAQYIAKAQETQKEGENSKKVASNAITLFPTICVFNAQLNAPPLPVKLDSNLPHCAIATGGGEVGMPTTHLTALMDSGAGATIGFQGYFEGAIFSNPSILEAVYTCKNGKYAPIIMHGIVHKDDGKSSTDLPIAFQIRTPYFCHDGSQVHFLVAVGMGVSVNFILSNPWLRAMRAVIDYDAGEMRVPLGDDVTKFKITYRAPVRSAISPAELKKYTTKREQAFHMRPKMESMLAVMAAYNPRSPFMPHARKLVKLLSNLSATPVPPVIKEKPIMPASVLRDGAVGGTLLPPTHQPSPPDLGAQETTKGVSFDLDSTHVSPEDADPGSITGDGLGIIDTGPLPVMDGTGAHAFGQATCNQADEEMSDDNEDLFADVA
jgi:hypothetical protein